MACERKRSGQDSDALASPARWDKLGPTPMLACPARLLPTAFRWYATMLSSASLLVIASPATAQPTDPDDVDPAARPADPSPAEDPRASSAAPPDPAPATTTPATASPSASPTPAPTQPLPEGVDGATPPEPPHGSSSEPPGEPPPPWLPPTRPPGVTTAPSLPADGPSDADAVNPLLYAGLGTAALGAAGMVVFGVAQSRLVQLENDPGYDAYRAGQTVDTDVCQAADQLVVVDGASSPTRIKRICSEAGTWETVSFVVLPTSIALLGVATYMIVAGSASEPEGVASVRVLPSVGPSGGALLVEGAF